jgi:lambda repressor-like predicted transcriptional regulator
MSTSQDLVAIIKAELKGAGITYAALARHLDLAESSVKRMFAKGDMPLARVDEICRVLKTDFADLSRKVADARPRRHELTVEQERAVVADRRLLLLALCCMSQWTLEQVVSTYRFTEAEVIRGFTRLDRLGIIELKPMNRYRLHIDKTFRWRPRGPVMKYFREQVIDDYYDGDFGGEGEMLMLVHGEIGRSLATTFVERLQRVGQDFAHQHLADQKLPSRQKRPYTLVVALRSWFFGAFRDMKRDAAAADSR